MNQVFLQFCSSSDLLPFEKRHYVEAMSKGDPNATPNSVKAGQPKGHHGQQLHYLIWVKFDNTHWLWQNVGAISGGSAIFSSSARDTFFGLGKFPKPKRGEKSPYLSGIIDNTLYHLEFHKPNLATKILSLWRKQVVRDWEFMYDVKPYGFETFVDEKRQSRLVWGEEPRTNPNFAMTKGGLYIADNWAPVGVTQGSAKDHVGKGLTGGLRGRPFRRSKVSVKIAYCKWIAPFTEPQMCDYKSSWRGRTPEEKALAKERVARRKQLTLRAQEQLKSLLNKPLDTSPETL